jgi:hypothetical protein
VGFVNALLSTRIWSPGLRKSAGSACPVSRDSCRKYAGGSSAPGRKSRRVNLHMAMRRRTYAFGPSRGSPGRHCKRWGVQKLRSSSLVQFSAVLPVVPVEWVVTMVVPKAPMALRTSAAEITICPTAFSATSVMEVSSASSKKDWKDLRILVT